MMYYDFRHAVEGIAGIAYGLGMAGKPITDTHIDAWKKELESYPEEKHV